ncbi:MAG: PQQ-dependent sugar dehydrogenase, partial [Rubrivivax sp.]|nr:PQQ-dependent sugar dehydrogenase [Rubrivivax sp.]
MSDTLRALCVLCTRRALCTLCAVCAVFTVALLSLLSFAARAQAPSPTLALQLVAQDLVAPIQLEQLPGAEPRFLVVQQDGVVRLLQPDGRVAAEPFLDLRSRMLPVANDFEERGLLGLALHPQFERNGRFFVTYSAPLRASAPQHWN